MSLRRWMREHLLGANSEGGDVPPGGSLVGSALGRDQERMRPLGEYDSTSYPQELAETLRRREEALRALMRLNVTEPGQRAGAVPELKELLRIYPHPLIYEALIHGYVEAGRPDEARGVAFAARERRNECARSPHPEIRAEIHSLQEWTAEDVAALSEDASRRR